MSSSRPPSSGQTRDVSFDGAFAQPIPDEFTMRIVVRYDFPEQGSLSYVVVPFDLEKNVAINEWGPMKIKSGVVQPHPHDAQNKSILYSLDMAELGMVPSWLQSKQWNHDLLERSYEVREVTEVRTFAQRCPRWP